MPANFNLFAGVLLAFIKKKLKNGQDNRPIIGR